MAGKGEKERVGEEHPKINLRLRPCSSHYDDCDVGLYHSVLSVVTFAYITIDRAWLYFVPDENVLVVRV